MSQIKELLPDPPVYLSVTPQATVAEACKIMGQHNAGVVMILDNEALLGVFSERDLVRRVLGQGKDPFKTAVSDVMTSKVVTVEAEEDPEDCLRKMEKESCRHLPIMSQGKPIAMLSIRDLMRYLLQKKEISLKMLEEYVTTG